MAEVALCVSGRRVLAIHVHPGCTGEQRSVLGAMPPKKVERYWPGKAPQYAKSGGGSDDDDSDLDGTPEPESAVAARG